MKLKGINPIEQHVDKIVLGGVTGVLLLVIALQFTTQPNMVQPDTKGGKFTPARAFEPAKRQAEELAARLNQQSPELPERPNLNLLSRLEANTGKPLIEKPAAVAMGVPVRVGGVVVAAPTDGRYAAIEIPVPVSPIAALYEHALDPSIVVQYPELKSRELVPQQQPYDKAAVSIEATFSGTALKAALERDPDGPTGELRPIPIAWWRDGVEILGVEVERQELTQSGTWSEPTLVPPMPGRANYAAEVIATPRVTVSLLRGFVDLARRFPDDVQRAPYYPILVGESWIPPSDAVRRQELEEQQVKIDRLTETLAELDARITALEGDIARAPERITQDRPPAGGGGGGGGGGGKSPGSTPGRGETPSTTERTPPPATKAQLTRQLEQVRRERTLRANELTALGAAPTTADTSGATTTAISFRGLFDTDSLKVWAHDFEAKRNATYRYRLRVVTNNPFFGNALSLPEDQKALAESPVLPSAWTDWTDPVGVSAPSYFFVTSAGASDSFGGMRAAASAYEFYYGYWRVGPVSLSPGDPIETRLRLPAPELLPIFDENTLAATDQPVQRPGFRDPEFQQEGGGGGKTGTGVIVETRPAAAAPSQPALPANSRPGPRERTISIDAVFLAAAPLSIAPASGPLGSGVAERYQAFLKGPDGNVFTRYPHLDRTSTEFRRLERSARLGERQGAPEPQADKPQPDPRQRPREQVDRPPSGGGGGGG